MPWQYRKKQAGHDWQPCTEDQAKGLQRTAALRRKFAVRQVEAGKPTPRSINAETPKKPTEAGK